MRPTPFLKLATTILAASAVIATACSEQDPTAPERMSPKNLRPSSTVITTTTEWDFVQLAGGEGDQGNSTTFTMPGAGSVVASATATDPGKARVYSKGFLEPVGSDERGLGLCRDFGDAGICLSDKDQEIGEDFGGDGVFPSLFLDFTGLTAGSVVTSVTLSSVQTSEGYSVSWSTDGSSYTLLQSDVGPGPGAIVSIPVPETAKFLRFDVGPGGLGNNYLVQSATVVSTTTTGKTFTIGPSSMEGAILISNGDWVNGGYSFKFKSNTHLATNFSVHATVSLTGPCIGGGPTTDTFTFPLNDATYAVPAGNTSWLPTGDANNVLSWQGSVVASGICGGIGKLDARKGAVFTATVSQDPPSGSLVDFRFKYRDPKAKGKPNTNCLDTSDPNRAKADVCGASWSQTVLDP
jgi:hypothetical protein